LVLDLGAGSGNFTAYLEQSGYSVVAVDIDEDDYRRAGHSAAPFLRADLDEGLPVIDGPVGGVLAVEVVEHLESPLRFVRLAADSLVNDGWLIISTPNVQSLSSRLERLVRGTDFQFHEGDYRSNGHISPVTLDQLRWIGGRVGLEIEAVTYSVGRIPLPRLRRRIELRQQWAKTALLGESLIVKLRKTGKVESFIRG
jgi:SAM-dependent methyltransferase